MLLALLVEAAVSVAYGTGWLLAIGRSVKTPAHLEVSETRGEEGTDSLAVMAKSGRPLHIGSAVTMALLISLTTWLASLAGTLWGSSGILGTTFLAGFADAQSSAFSAASLVSAGVTTPQQGALAVLAAFTANTLTKISLAYFAGSRAYACRTIPGVVLVLLAIWIAHLLPN